MTNGGNHGVDPPPVGGGNGDFHVMPEIVRHLTLALSGHVRRLHQEGVPVPREVEELAYFLVRLARVRQDPPRSANGGGNGKDARLSDRLLVTKAEAAERLGVSVRTIERLAASGRLPQVNVERLARFRVTDLVSYVDNLGDDCMPLSRAWNSVRVAGMTAPPDG